MLKRLCLLVIGGMVMLTMGCQATPGFKFMVSWELPPAVKQQIPLQPVPTPPTTTYMIQGPSDMPIVTHQIRAVPAPVRQPLQTVPCPEALPAPTPVRPVAPMPNGSPCGVTQLSTEGAISGE